MNLTNDGASLIDSATRLRNFTSENLPNITHVRDFDFLVTTLENYNKFLESEPKVSIQSLYKGICIKRPFSEFFDNLFIFLILVGRVFNRNHQFSFKTTQISDGESSAAA